VANEAAGVTYPSNSNIAYSTGTPRMSTRFKSVLLTPSSWGLKSQTDARPPTRGFAGLFSRSRTGSRCGRKPRMNSTAPGRLFDLVVVFGVPPPKPHTALFQAQ
jgi:hypothetical protein